MLRPRSRPWPHGRYRRGSGHYRCPVHRRARYPADHATFHIGGTARGSVEQAEVRTQRGGEIRYKKLHSVMNNDGLDVVINRNAEITVLDDQGVDRSGSLCRYGATLLIKDGQLVNPGTVIAAWDAFSIPIVAEVGGKIKYGDVVEGQSMQERMTRITGKASKMVTTVSSSKQMNPRISIKDERGRTLASFPEEVLAARYPLPVGSRHHRERAGCDHRRYRDRQDSA